jgi:alanine racemase
MVQHRGMARKDERDFARTWAEIDLSAIVGNVRAIERLAGPNGVVMAVVKANGYGHGAIPVARACAAAGVTHFAVATAEEGLELRAASLSGDIYVLSPFLPDEASALVRADLIPLLSTSEQAEALAIAAERAPFPARAFLMVDTGMGREGCLPDEARDLWRTASRLPSLRLTGIATHYACADDPAADAVTEAQTAAFQEFLASLGPNALADAEDGRGGRGLWLSLANSPGTLRLPPHSLPPGARGYLYRAGAILYGIEPYREAFTGTRLRPALTWRTCIAQVRSLPAGFPIGYGHTYTLTRPSRIATLAVGYADGFPRRLSNQGHVLIHCQRFPLVGRISMDQCQVDVTDARPPVAAGDTVTLIGADGSEVQTILDIAEAIQTTSHEPACALARRVVRRYRVS